MRQLICRICGSGFETDKPNQKYCSFVCKEAGRRIRHKDWKASNPGYNTEYAREYRKRTIQEQSTEQ